MIQVTKKDARESTESLIRRFNRKVQQLAEVKQLQYHEKPISKRDRRTKAIIRNERKAQKNKRAKLGLR
jgi:ribosomal protein S21